MPDISPKNQETRNAFPVRKTSKQTRWRDDGKSASEKLETSPARIQLKKKQVVQGYEKALPSPEPTARTDAHRQEKPGDGAGRDAEGSFADKLREHSFRQQQVSSEKDNVHYRQEGRAKTPPSADALTDPATKIKRRTIYKAAEERKERGVPKEAPSTSTVDRSANKPKARKQEAKTETGSKLRFEKESSSNYQSALRFDDPLEPKKKGLLKKGAGAVGTIASEGARAKLREAADGNAGLGALDGAERSLRSASSMVQKHRKNSATRTVKKRERLRTKALYRDANQVADEAVSRSGSTNPVSRYFQKKRIKRQYVAQARTARQAHLTQKRGRRAKKATGKARNSIKQFRRGKSKVYLAIALVAFLFLGSIFSFFFSAGTILGGSAIGGIAGTPPGGKIFISPFDFDWTPTVTDRFGYRTHPITGEENSFHTGLDLAVPAGTPIRAVQSGTVLLAVNGTDGYGRYVLIQHENGYQTLYAHCSELLVTAGQKVTMGETIAKVGSTGTSTGNHLHIEVRKDGEFLDPYPLLATGNEVNTGSQAMVDVAATQIGNVGGRPYWSWYGFSSRVEWCAVFVSWCAGQNGYIDAGSVPKFAGCMQGSHWFMERNLWMPRGYLPLPGEIIFFDWDGDELPDHVGIVEVCDGSTVYTIEGNTSDSVARRTYSVNSQYIYGYGTPIYY